MSHLKITIFRDIKAHSVKPHSRTYNSHAIMRGLRNISRLRRSIFKIKTKDNANPLFFTLRHFDALRQSHIKIYTNTLMWQLHKTNRLSVTQQRTAPTYRVRAPLGQSRNFWIAPCILHKEHLTSKLFLPCVWNHCYQFTMKTKDILNHRGELSSPAFSAFGTDARMHSGITDNRVLFALNFHFYHMLILSLNKISTAVYMFK